MIIWTWVCHVCHENPRGKRWTCGTCAPWGARLPPQLKGLHSHASSFLPCRGAASTSRALSLPRPETPNHTDSMCLIAKKWFPHVSSTLNIAISIGSATARPLFVFSLVSRATHLASPRGVKKALLASSGEASHSQRPRWTSDHRTESLPPKKGKRW